MVATSNDDIKALTHAAEQLISRMGEINHDTNSTIVRVAKQTRLNQRLIRFLIISLIFVVVLTLAMIFEGIEIVSNTKHIDKITSRLDEAQTTQRAKVLCPLYKLFIDSEKFTPPNQTPEQVLARAQAFRTIHEGFDVLKCKDTIG